MPIKTLFVEDGTVRIDMNEIEEDFYVEAIKSMAYDKYREIFLAEDKSDIEFLKHVIRGWNFKDSEDNEVDCTKENIARLSSCYVLAIAMRLTDLYTPEKKTLMAYSQGFMGALRKEKKD